MKGNNHGLCAKLVSRLSMQQVDKDQARTVVTDEKVMLPQNTTLVIFKQEKTHCYDSIKTYKPSDKR